MAVIALLSAKGSPGVTTTALAMTLSWPRPVLLVEADPAGGDILPGYIRGQVPMDRGLVQVAVSARHNRIAADFNGALLDLAKPKSEVSRVLLSGLADPAQAATVGPVWDRLAAHFAVLGHADSGSDVIIDCGRLSTTFPPLPLIAAADLVLIVVRATLRSASAAKSAVAAAQVGLGPAGRDRIGLVVVEGGEYRTAELAKALQIPVLATIPWRPGEAAALSDGVGRVAGSSALMRAARGIEPVVRARTAASSPAGAGDHSVAPPFGTVPPGPSQQFAPTAPSSAATVAPAYGHGPSRGPGLPPGQGLAISQGTIGHGAAIGQGAGGHGASPVVAGVQR